MKREPVITYGIEQLSSVVNVLNELRRQRRVFTFTGPLGAGKTTLVKALLKECGIDQVVTSPTFAYVNSYKNKQNELFYHFDLYRINSVDEFLAQGFDEFLYQENSWVFIEWPNVIESLLKQQVCHVNIDYEGIDKRKLTIIKEL